MENKVKGKTQNDILKEYNTVLELRERTLESFHRLIEKDMDRCEKSDPESRILLDKIFMLRWVMVSKTGDMSYAAGESLTNTNVFDENDMITLKGKMMELIKKL